MEAVLANVHVLGLPREYLQREPIAADERVFHEPHVIPVRQPARTRTRDVNPALAISLDARRADHEERAADMSVVPVTLDVVDEHQWLVGEQLARPIGLWFHHSS